MTSGSDRERLDSWKTIAAYLKRDVRTIQRWELHEGLPVHRKLHDKLSSIYAFKDELDRWWGGNHSKTSPQHPEASAFRRPLLAVLPLRNLSGNNEEEYFSDGLTEELISQLSRINPQQIGVIARGSTMRYKGNPGDFNRIARELGASYILDGSVRRSGNQVRIAIQLIEVSDNGHLWADSYDRGLIDILELQDEVARDVTRQIAGHLAARDENRLRQGRQVVPKAYEAYLRGRVLWNQRSPSALARAVTFFEESISLDPDYAPAYAGIADSYSMLSTTAVGACNPAEVMPRARFAAARAVELDPLLAEAHTSLACVKLFHEWDWTAAGNFFDRALKLNSGYATGRQWYAEYLGSAGLIDDAITELLRAQEVDPLPLTIPEALASMHYLNRDYTQAIALSRRTLEVEPGFPLSYLNLGRAYVQQRMFREAIANLTEGRKLHPDSTAILMTLAHAYAAAGKEQEARGVLTSLKRIARRRYVPAFHFAATLAALGDHEQTFAWLERARQERCDYFVYLDREPGADSIRHDPRFAEIVPRSPVDLTRPPTERPEPMPGASSNG
jgi:TolB-like protein